MIILGDVSGIQNYVFDVAEEGGGQAQRLRARSFFVQLLAEIAALRLLRALEWPLDSIRLSGAGKFLLWGSKAPDAEKRLAKEQQFIEEWLLRETRAELRLTIAWIGGRELPGGSAAIAVVQGASLGTDVTSRVEHFASHPRAFGYALRFVPPWPGHRDRTRSRHRSDPAGVSWLCKEPRNRPKLAPRPMADHSRKH